MNQLLWIYFCNRPNPVKFQVRTLERQLQSERGALTNQSKYTEEIEEMLKTTAEQAQKQVERRFYSVFFFSVCFNAYCI